MLEQARKRYDVEWVHGDLSSVDWDREFDLIVMTGHAFQVLVEDDPTAHVAGRYTLGSHGGRSLRVRDSQSVGSRMGGVDTG